MKMLSRDTLVKNTQKLRIVEFAPGNPSLGQEVTKSQLIVEPELFLLVGHLAHMRTSSCSNGWERGSDRGCLAPIKTS